MKMWPLMVSSLIWKWLCLLLSIWVSPWFFLVAIGFGCAQALALGFLALDSMGENWDDIELYKSL